MNVKRMKEAGLVCTPPIYGKLVSYLVPEANKGANFSTVLLNKQCRFSVDQLDKVYQESAVSSRCGYNKHSSFPTYRHKVVKSGGNENKHSNKNKMYPSPQGGALHLQEIMYRRLAA